jgi:ABC-2 type transport system ATP-binding protein
MSYREICLGVGGIASMSGQGTAAFECTSLTKSFGRRKVLEGLDLRIEPGQRIGLLGANGAGKTTLLKIMLGLLPPTTGQANVAGENAGSLSPEVRARVGYVPQTPNQFSWLTGHAMLRYVAAFYPRFDWPYTKSLSERWKLSLKTPIGVLSPGQQQRLSIVRALAPRPDLVVLDEPIAALDPATRIAVIDELAREHEAREISVIFSSHITGDLERLCSHFTVLAEGKVVFSEPADVCRSLVRVHVTGHEQILASAPFPGSVRVRKPHDGERVLVCSRDRSAAMVDSLPAGMDARVEGENFEAVMSEWMQ